MRYIRKSDNNCDDPDTRWALYDDDDNYVARAQIMPDSITGWPGIWGVEVEDEHRGKGYGRRIMRHLISVARRRKYAVIYLKVEARNEVALNLYHSLGFVEDDHYSDVVVMRLDLDAQRMEAA